MKRSDDIDIFRAGGILLMIMGHIEFGDRFDHFIHAFHMPMFFFVAGIFFRLPDEMSFDRFVRKKAKTTLLPYVVFGLFHYLFQTMTVWPEFDLEPLKRLAFENTSDLPIAGALWFLTAFFFAELIYYLVRKEIQRSMLCNIVIVCISVLGCLCTSILPFRLPWALDASFVGVGLIHLGWLFGNKVRLKHLGYCIVLGIVTVFLIFINGYINMRTGTYAIIPLFWLNAMLAIVVGINISSYIAGVAPKFIKKYLTSIGRESIVYLCLNQLVIQQIRSTLGYEESSGVLLRIVILIGTMAVLYVCARFIMDTKLKMIVGK